MLNKHIVVLAAALILITCVAGCTNPLSPSPEPSAIVNATGAANDVKGKDLPDVPRYTNSVRVSYQESNNSTTVVYQTNDSYSKVVDFYNSEMQNRGYQVSARNSTNPAKEGNYTQFAFTKGSVIQHVTVASDSKNKTTIFVSVVK
jgi:hypothetical protein